MVNTKVGLLVGSALVLSLSGCHVTHFETAHQISTEGLQQGLKDAAKEKQKIELQKVECQGPLDGKLGATQKCTVIDDEGIHYDVVVTTTSVEGKDIKFNYSVKQTSN
ncbi:hypothetical protein PROPHIGD16-1_52 [Mycobacterium phage prophiGD16-1]|uniref:DUF4333 domain-containing protein n=1 Tax=Mycobacteroides abscessus TaxID=36809 RepID=UPI00092A1C37|nr:DUF4333 domain-containing protein [Mycobacteroides abscessus]QST88977.1 hypothetical protein PROPHIGD16-1_52 [Mycobacterium phage prophiGD16-1]SHX34603.1 Uncharacterised protein [Mycobacteroides abscessus subsp. abscessus]SHX50274.1 Uncharacterised protein [Mycobacteroides abscessus subsp. abscessus]SIC52363.1 Uncharacterised protein [Mycobacteroides abscessus subsp. abscessus]SKV76560.1 Uncharacterised protein [Mycobacteroides abscessus subsp. abscessus]